MSARVWCAVLAVAMAGCADRRDRGHELPPTGDAGTMGEPDAGIGVAIDASTDCGPGEIGCTEGCCPEPLGEHVVFDDEAVERSIFAVSSSGVPHIVFTPYEGLVHATRAADGTWTIAPIPGAERARFATIAAAPDDRIHILYTVDYELFWARWQSGSWRTESVDPGYAVTGYALTVDAGGEPRVAYQIQQFEGGFTRDELWYAERAAGSFRWELVHAEAHDVGWSPSIAVDSRGNVGIVYCQDICYGQPDIAIKRVGGSWEHNTLPESIGRSQTTIAIDASDDVHLAWMDHVEGTVMHAYLTEDGWLPLTVDAAFPNVGGRVQLMSDADSGLHAFYGERHASVPSTGSWTVTPLALEHADRARDVKGGVDATGALHVSYAWRDSATGEGELRYLRIASP